MSHKGKNKSKVYNSAEGYDLYASYYDDNLKLLTSFEKGKLFGLAGDLGGRKVLDVGCGTGRIIGELKLFGAEVTACDVSREMLKVVKKKYPDVKTAEGSIEDLPFEDGLFDAVFATFVIVHLKDLDRAFGEVYRVLKEGGIFVVTNINQRKPPKLKTKAGEVVINSYYHRPADVLDSLDRNFFEVERNEFVMEGRAWINQIVKARKK